ncbi:MULTISPECIES: DoxX family protein [unclassified Variovorax]|jgi:putative oxidoreductase|uniref:DoxX family protein n=1 Tax=unclassified Variovorax TaxID=663243 RepID=UPI0008B2C524|nr:MULTISPECIES: DoxX family protein [unclassified Variovorax]SEK15642.1 putative oxidoreductase [Variovorax sp. OK202]SFE18417.1 putative oxidoreductase [Variovorax sp. OK212]
MTTNESHRGAGRWTTAARVLMAVIFLVAGVRKLMTYGATLGYFAKLGIPMADVVLPLTIALEVGGGLLLVAGWRVQWVAAALALFTLATAFTAHAFWAADAAQFAGQLNNFLKNVAMVGGFLLLIAHADGATRQARAGG